MASHECRIETLRRAYRIIGVPSSASAATIKHSYRRLIKRWHPDKHAYTDSSCREATEMTKSINQSYAEIQHAPLRYYFDRASAAENTVENAGSVEDDSVDGITLGTDRLEFCVRFVCGCLLGLFVSLGLFLQVFVKMDILTALAVGALTLSYGFAAARYGDRFWHSVLKYWWLWT